VPSAYGTSLVSLIADFRAVVQDAQSDFSYYSLLLKAMAGVYMQVN
jgi:hypothetical protein